MMKPDQQQIELIRTSFANMQSREDFLHLLNDAKIMIYGDKAVPFKLKQLTWYSNPKLGGKRYKEFKVKKKKPGEFRSIHAPVSGLKTLQRTIAFVLQCVFQPHEAAKGFVPGRSIVDNARLHEGQNYVYNIDLKDFFPSIDQARIWKCLQLSPFNLNLSSPAVDLKVKEDASILPLELQNFKNDGNINDIVWKYKFDGYSFPAGTFNLKLKDGGNILYSIEKINKLDNEGQIVIFPSQSKFETIRSLADQHAQDKGLDSGLVLKIMLSQFIEFHQNKLNKKNTRLRLANIIAAICCTELEVQRKEAGEWVSVKRNVLPQGAPTSPVLTNIVCQRLDFILTGVAKRFGLRYSRYADDITFSSKHNVYQPEGKFIKELHRVVEEQSFHINESKTRLQKDGYRKEVTGLLVNEKANVQQRYIKQLRMWLYYWERYGYDRASGFFMHQYIADKGHIMKGKPDMANVISGKLDYLKMVRGNENELYMKFKVRFEALINIDKDIIIETKPDQLDQILSLDNFDELKSTLDETHENEMGKLRLNIKPLGPVKGQVRLERKIIIDKGKSLPLEEFIENKFKEEKEIDLSRHKPVDVTRFLLNFRASEGLKFLTHDYDKANSLFEYEDVLKIAKKEFDDLSSQFVIPQSLLARIHQFAFGDPQKVWWFNKDKFTLNWKSPELIAWLKMNPNTHPIKNEEFEKGFIAPFKKSIEIKAPELEYIFKNKLAENLESKYLSFDIKLIDLDKANFYTNVDALQVGISYIIKAIKQRFSNSNKIKIEFSRKADAEGRKRIIKIVHIDSVCNKALVKNELFQGDLLEAEKALIGICDWSIISKSPDASVNKLNILFDINSNIKPTEKIDESLVEGFTHILTFYS